jgi:hypothetical protein
MHVIETREARRIKLYVVIEEELAEDVEFLREELVSEVDSGVEDTKTMLSQRG